MLTSVYQNIVHVCGDLHSVRKWIFSFVCFVVVIIPFWMESANNIRDSIAALIGNRPLFCEKGSHWKAKRIPLNSWNEFDWILGRLPLRPFNQFQTFSLLCSIFLLLLKRVTGRSDSNWYNWVINAILFSVFVERFDINGIAYLVVDSLWRACVRQGNEPLYVLHANKQILINVQ